uniref:Uncharacterized protein n=1 Tax=Hyaloperonospora arabidopsidis (strain Emoy2) TaxID=559515 RepID=M4B3G7_HYAAE
MLRIIFLSYRTLAAPNRRSQMDPPTKKRRAANDLLPCPPVSDTSSTSTSRHAEYDAETMQQQLKLFIRSEDVSSAQILGDFLVALALAPPDSKGQSRKKTKKQYFDKLTVYINYVYDTRIVLK